MKSITGKRCRLVLIVFLFSLFFLCNVCYAAANTKTYDKKVSGATDIAVSSSQKSTIYLYNSFLNKTLKKPFKTYKNCTSANYKANYSNSHHYYVVIKSKKTITTTCSIKQHQDTKTVRKKGIRWIANGNSAFPSNSIYYLENVYFSKNQVSKALEMIDEDENLDHQTQVLNLTWFLSTTGLGVYSSSQFVTGLFTVTDFVQIFKGVDFKQVTKKKVKEKSGYTYDKKKHKGSAKKGILITRYISGGIEQLEVKSWNGKSVKGAKGYRGKWRY